MLLRVDVVTCSQVHLPASVRTWVYPSCPTPPQERQTELASHLLAVLRPQGGSTVAYSGDCISMQLCGLGWWGKTPQGPECGSGT